jgi:hypothetical protein
MGTVDRHAPCFVDGSGIAVIAMGVGLEIDLDLAANVEPGRKGIAVGTLDGTERSVLPATLAMQKSGALV